MTSIPAQLDPDTAAAKGSANIKPVWIVTPENGLHQVATSAVDAAISNGKGRVATERDLAIAGLPSATQEN